MEKALEYHKKGLEIKLQILGSDHRSTASSINNIA